MKLSNQTELGVWTAAFAARAALVVQQQMLYLSAESCAIFADAAVYEYRKRLS